MFWFLMLLAGVTIYFGAMALEGKARAAFYFVFSGLMFAVIISWVRYQNTVAMLEYAS